MASKKSGALSSEKQEFYTLEQLKSDLELFSAAEGTPAGKDLARLIIASVAKLPEGEEKKSMIQKIDEFAAKRPKEWEEQYKMEFTTEETAYAQSELQQMSEAGEIGEVIVDFGAGINPVSKGLAGKHKIVEVDLWADEEKSTEDRLCIQLDLKEVSQCTQECREALQKALDFIKVEGSETGSQGDGADVFVFSSILNYLDFRNVIPRLLPYLNKDGKIVVLNAPGEGVVKYLSDRRPIDNLDLVNFFRQEGFQVKRSSYPRSSSKKTPESDYFSEMMFVVFERVEG